MINLRKLNIFLSTLNFVLPFVGYQLVTSIFLPASSDIENISRIVTVPYRAFALLISFLVILLNIKEKRNFKAPLAFKMLLIYWILLIIRMFYDINFSLTNNLNDTSQLWLFVFGVCLPTVISVAMSYDKIDFSKLFNWVALGVFITLFVTFFSNQAMFMEDDSRMDANLALNTISFGHIAVIGIVLALFSIYNKKMSLFQKIYILLLLVISFYSLLRAGSRGPFVALIVVLLFWTFSKGKNMLISVSIIIITLSLIIVFINPILNLIGDISPIMQERLQASIFEGDTSERTPLYIAAIDAFADSPFIGKQFALFHLHGYGDFIYSHNIILDSFMGMGIFGGLMMLYILFKALIDSVVLIKYNDKNYWIFLILIQQISFNMLSGAIYFNQLLNALLAFVFVYYFGEKDMKPKKIK